jgi:ATP-dependent Lhr-like helicase
LRLRGDDLTYPRFEEALTILHDPAFWNDQGLWRGVFNSLPNYRLSKFQPLMPPWVEREVVASYLLDVRGAERWLKTVRGRCD